MKNAIVILNYNDLENTKKIIENIKDYQILDYIIIVDNKSTDNSLNSLKKLENEKIKVIDAKENKGYAAGNNVGIKYLLDNTKVENIIISNPDIIVEENTIKNLIKNLENKDIAVIAPLIKEPSSLSNGWKLPTFLSELVSNIPILRRYEQKILSYKEYDNLTKVDVVKGCFFIVKREVFDKIGLFNEGTFLYYEENILGKKLKDMGYNTYVDKTSVVIHNLSQSVDKSIKKINKFKILKDSQYYYEKNIIKSNIFRLLILRIFYYIYLFLLKITLFIKDLFKK